jgi:hypothetical protein
MEEIISNYSLLSIIWFYNHGKWKPRNQLCNKYVINQYNENGNLTNGGARYDVGRGNYSVIVQNDKNKKYYIEVKLNNNLTLVSVEDDTSNMNKR